VQDKRKGLGYSLYINSVQNLTETLLSSLCQTLIKSSWLYSGLGVGSLTSARIVLYMLLSIMFCCFQRERIGGIQEFQSVVLNLENERRMQDKEMERNKLAHRWYLIHATMPIVFMSEIVLSHLSSMVESCSSSLLLIHGQIMSRGNSTGLGHINILLDLSSTKDYRMLLYMIGMMLDLWDMRLRP